MTACHIASRLMVCHCDSGVDKTCDLRSEVKISNDFLTAETFVQVLRVCRVGEKEPVARSHVHFLAKKCVRNTEQNRVEF